MRDVTLRFRGAGLVVRNLERVEGRLWGEVEVNGVEYVVKFIGDGEWVVVGPKRDLEGMVEQIEQVELTDKEKALAVEPWGRCTRERVM